MSLRGIRYFISETVGTSYISQSSVLHVYKEYVLEGNIAVENRAVVDHSFFNDHDDRFRARNVF